MSRLLFVRVSEETSRAIREGGSAIGTLRPRDRRDSKGCSDSIFEAESLVGGDGHPQLALASVEEATDAV